MKDTQRERIHGLYYKAGWVRLPCGMAFAVRCWNLFPFRYFTSVGRSICLFVSFHLGRGDGGVLMPCSGLNGAEMEWGYYGFDLIWFDLAWDVVGLI